MAITPTGRLLTFGPTLFVAKKDKFDPNKAARFEGLLVLDKVAQGTPEYAALRKLLADELNTFFVQKMSDASFRARLKLPLKADEKYAPNGAMLLKAWSNSAPQVVDSSLQTITVSGDVWSGQLARFDVNCKGFDKAGSVGANFYLNNVQITSRNQPRLDGKVSADKVFGKIAEEAGDDVVGGKAMDDDDLPF